MRNLALQMFPSKVNFFMNVYKTVTEKHFAYILCDLYPLTDDKLWIRSSIFPERIPLYMCLNLDLLNYVP